MDSEKIVRDFCAAVAQRDIDALLGFFSDDAVYHNIPIAPVQGRDAIRATLEQFLGPATQAEFEILALAVAGHRVLTERIDRFSIHDRKIELPVMGVFEVTADGKISAWRDYFDLQQFSSQMA